MATDTDILFTEFGGSMAWRAADLRDDEWRLALPGPVITELGAVVDKVRGATVLGQEDTGARMNRIAKAELQGEDLMSIDQLLARVDQVSTADVHDVARDLLAAPASLAVIGPYADADTFASSR